MPNDQDKTELLCEQVLHACNNNKPLAIRAGNSKRFYGREVEGDALLVDGHLGILSYEASELVITARAGTRLSEIEAVLERNGQQLAFEPPMHSERSTLGGAIASGLSGPARAFNGAARDFVLGAKIINGKAELMQFGGQVMKNVAGYDVSRLMVGAQGTLGVLLEISLKVLPKPEAEMTLSYEADAITAHRWLRDWLHRGLPITASCHYQRRLSLRLGSTENSLRAAHKTMGGEIADSAMWPQLRDQTHTFFAQPNLWRLSLPPSAALENDEDSLIEWGGALRWKASNNKLFEKARRLKGHATRYQSNAAAAGTNPAQDIFQPLQPTVLAIHQRLKKAFDPLNILNPGRMYEEL